MITAKQAAELVAPYVDKSYPQHRSELFLLLRNAINKAWAEGNWWGQTKEFFVRVQTDENGNKFFISPTGYDTLLAVNVHEQPKLIRDRYFQFHRNGSGSIVKDCGLNNWSEDVIDDGHSSTFVQLNIKFPSGFMVGARSLGLEAGASLRVYGDTTFGNPAITKRIIQQSTGLTCGCGISAKDPVAQIEADYGLSLPLNKEFNYISDVLFNEVSSLKKSVTANVIQVLGVGTDGVAMPIAEILPHQTESRYRRYLVPNNCVCTTCVLGLFKVAKQDNIAFENQPLLIDNEEALISLCMGWHKFFNKQELDMGSTYILAGIAALEKETRELQSPMSTPIQIDGLGSDDMPEIFNYY